MLVMPVSWPRLPLSVSSSLPALPPLLSSHGSAQPGHFHSGLSQMFLPLTMFSLLFMINLLFHHTKSSHVFSFIQESVDLLKKVSPRGIDFEVSIFHTIPSFLVPHGCVSIGKPSAIVPAPCLLACCQALCLDGHELQLSETVSPKQTHISHNILSEQ